MSPRIVTTEPRSRLPAGLDTFLTTLVVMLHAAATEHEKRSRKAKGIETGAAELAAALVLASLAEAIDGARRAVS